jgi:hypothetical protein
MRLRPDGSLLLAIAIHVPVALVVLNALAPPRYFDWWWSARVPTDASVERLRYVDIRPAPAIPPAPAPRPLTDASRRAETLAPTAPSAVGATESAPSVTALRTDYAAALNVGVDATDPRAVVLVPQSADPRIWNAPSAYAPKPTSHAESLEGTLARDVRASNDAIAALGVQTVRPEWAVTRNGRRYGVDDKAIHLGKVTVPAMLVGLLPISGFGCVPTMYMPDRPVRDSVGMTCAQLQNPKLDQRPKVIDEMNAEVRARAPLIFAAREEIAKIAARKDREREQRLRAQDAAPARAIAKPPG